MFGKTRATTSPGLTPAAASFEAAESTRCWRRECERSNFPDTDKALRSGNCPATVFNNPVRVGRPILLKRKEMMKLGERNKAMMRKGGELLGVISYKNGEDER